MPTELYEIYGQKFNWEMEKNIQNIEKHGVPFKEAATVFRDESAVIFDDKEHSQEEERFKIIGFSKNFRLLTVCHCCRENDSIVRIISARKATKQEHKQYGGRN